MTDNVNSPAHYKRFRFECEPKDFTKFLPHPLASAVEYYIRAPFKSNELEDLQKASVWLDEIIRTDVFWVQVAEKDICHILQGACFSDLCRYKAAAFAMVAFCNDLIFLFFDGNPIYISKFGVEQLRTRILLRINELQKENNQEDLN